MQKLSRLWRWFSVLLATGVVMVVGCAATGAADYPATPPASVATPGAVRVIQDDQWVYFNELSTGSGFVEVSTEPWASSIVKTPRGWKINVTWTLWSHSFVDVQYNQVEGSDRSRARRPSDIREPTLQNSARTTRNTVRPSGSASALLGCG